MTRPMVPRPRSEEDAVSANPPQITVPQIQRWLDESPFIAALGLTCERIDSDQNTVWLKMPMLPILERGPGSGQFHGGPIASLIDTAGDFAVVLVTRAGVPTVNFRVDYLRPSVGSYLIAKATARRTGRTIAVADVDVYDEQERLTAVGRGCYAMTPG